MKEGLMIVQARMGSRRLPGKSLLKLGNKPLLLRVIDSAWDMGQEYDLIVATSQESNCDPLCRILIEYNINFLRGDEDNVLSRFLEIKKNNIHYKYFIRITADSPCHSKDLLKKGIEKFKSEELDYFRSDIKYDRLPNGLIFEIFKPKMLDKIEICYAHDEKSKEHVTYRLTTKEVKCRSGTFTDEDIKEYTCPGLKLCVDEKKDYERMIDYWNIYYINGLFNTTEVIRNERGYRSLKKE